VEEEWGGMKLNATVEITDHLVGMWYLPLTDDSDWLCGLTELESEKRYQMKFRFRYYKDDKAFDSKDERSSYVTTADCTKAYALATVRHLGNEMLAHGARGPLDELLMVNGDTRRFARELQDKPWAFMRMESIGNASGPRG
jgi:hypothetical protein